MVVYSFLKPKKTLLERTRRPEPPSVFCQVPSTWTESGLQT